MQLHVDVTDAYFAGASIHENMENTHYDLPPLEFMPQRLNL